MYKRAFWENKIHFNIIAPKPHDKCQNLINSYKRNVVLFTCTVFGSKEELRKKIAKNYKS